MTYTDVLKELKEGIYHPIYLLHGAEPYFIDIVSDYIEAHALDEGGKAFNQIVVYGKDIDVKAVLDEARQYPMMADRRVVIVKEAQDLPKIQDLLSYAEQPSPQTVLVLAHKYKKIKKNTKLAKAIAKSGVIIDADAIRDYKMADWIVQYVKDQHLSIAKDTANLLAEYLGTDLSKVTNEISKLILNLGDEKTITAGHVQEQVGISKEYNVFELHKALSHRDVLKIHRIINFFAGDQKNNHITMIISSLYGYYVKVFKAAAYQSQNDAALAKLIGLGSPYFVKEYRSAIRHYPMSKLPTIFEALATADKHSKGVDSRSTNAKKIMQELIFTILG